MLKKKLSLGLCAVVLCSSVAAMAVEGEPKMTPAPAAPEITAVPGLPDVSEPQALYFYDSGEIKEINMAQDTAGRARILLDKGGEDTVVLNFAAEATYIADQESSEPIGIQDLKVGDIVTVYSHVSTPVANSIPPQYTPEVMVVKSGDESAEAFKVDVFDNEGISSDGMLKLNLGEETRVSGYDGTERSAADAYGQTLLVYYGASTKSIPAQTTPDKVVILKSRDRINAENYVRNLDEEYTYVTGEAVRVQLRHVAEDFGYTVEWIADTQSIALTKGAVSFTLTIGSADYGYNRSMRQFENAPMLVEGKTYVDSAFVEELIR